jgi:putative ABC transport system permease protein
MSPARAGRRLAGRPRLAWQNLAHRRLRTATALSAVAFSILLVFMQIGFYTSCRTSSVLMHRLLDFDAILVSSKYLYFAQPGAFPESRVHLARAVEGVQRVGQVRLVRATWRNVEIERDRSVLVLGVEPDERPFVVATLNDRVPALSGLGRAIFDADSHPSYGPTTPGTTSELGGRRSEIIGQYHWGAGFLNGAVVVGRGTFASLSGDRPPNHVSFGLVKLEPDLREADRRAALERVAGALPGDTQLFTRAQIERHDQGYFMRDRPIGLIFTSGVVLALLIGSVIVYQVISSDISDQLAELATLKALGYTASQIRAMVLEQGLIYGGLAFVPAAIGSVGLYATLRSSARLPVEMTPGIAVTVLALALGMCTTAGLLALRKLERADPADLFG